MKRFITAASGRFNNLLVGFLGVFAVFIVVELFATPLFFWIALVLIVVAVVLAKKMITHFHGHHHASGDSAVHVIAPFALLLANLLHPAVDGYLLFQTIAHGGLTTGMVVIVGILLHEVLRQSALISVFRPFRIEWYVVLTTAAVGMAGGVWLGSIQSTLIGKYDFIAELAAVFAYTFIASELYFHTTEHSDTKKRRGWIVVGGLIAIVLHYTVSLH